MSRNYILRHQNVVLPTGKAEEDFYISKGELSDSGTLLKLQMFIDSKWNDFHCCRESSSNTAFIGIIISGRQMRNGMVLHPGDVIFERSRSEQLTSFALPGSQLHRKVIILTINPVFKLLSGAIFSENTTIIRKVSNSVKELFDRIQDAVSNDAGEKHVSTLIFDLIQELSCCRNSSKLPKKLENILNMIKTGNLQNISREYICRKCGISNRQLNNIFQKYMHTSPVQYIIAKKMEFAKELLSSKKLTVNEVAEICGFSSTEFFIRTFKKHTGFTPGKWKNRHE